MLDFLLRPLRSALGVAEHEVFTPLEGTEREILGAVDAIEQATESIERHVKVIEGLATSVGPLTESVNHLTATMADLVALLAPVGKAEHEVARVERFFGLRRHREGQGSGPESVQE
jgi:hypothetical protein